jgi:hypothetical protein
MEIEGCNCSEFRERDDLIPCKSLLVQEAPFFKGKSISQELAAMDQSEYQIIKAEEASLVEKDLGVIASIGLLINLVSLVGLVVGLVGLVVKLVFTNSSGQFGKICGLSIVGVFLGPMIAEPFVFSNELERKRRMQEIYEDRLLRLINKSFTLKQKILKTEDPVIKEELTSARDFFKTKYIVYLAARNKPLNCRRV